MDDIESAGPSSPRTVIAGPEVVLLDVSTTRGDERVLFRLNLRIAPGRIVAVVGGSEAGKSTLVRHVVGLEAPDTGRVLVGGEDLAAASRERRREMRRRMGVVVPATGAGMYDASTFGSETARDNLTWSLELHGVPAQVRVARAEATLRALDLMRHADDLPSVMPAHARRRLALARALVLNAPLTVLDELEGGLDAQHAAAMARAIRAAHGTSGGTMIIATHHLGLARAVADEVAILAHGRIVAHGAPDDVLHDIAGAEEFEERYAASDWMGAPPAPDDEPDRGWAVHVDPAMVRVAVAGVVLLAVLALLITHLDHAGLLPLLP